jgi:hypothetical protein
MEKVTALRISDRGMRIEKTGALTEISIAFIFLTIRNPNSAFRNRKGGCDVRFA